MKKQANEKISNLIVKKYGEFNPENMRKFFTEEFFVSSRGRKIDQQDYSLILAQIEKLVEVQGLTLDDIDYLGFGQRYTTLGIGNAVLKIGNTTEKVYENPFRLSPVYKEDLKKDLGIYVSQRAQCGKVNESVVQEMYNSIRLAGGLWLDVKDENLGYVQEKMDFSSIYPNQEGVNIVQDKEFPTYTGNCFVIDYEDIIFLTPQLRTQMLNFEAPNINSISRELLLGQQDNETIYFDEFIKNSNKLLEYERNYQRQIGNRNQEKRCTATIRENNRRIRQARYVEEQRYRYDRNYSDIGAKFSAKEIGTQVMQKTNFSRLQQIVKTVNSKIREIRESSRNTSKMRGIRERKTVFQEAKKMTDPYTTEATSPVDISDPYSTR